MRRLYKVLKLNSSFNFRADIEAIIGPIRPDLIFPYTKHFRGRIAGQTDYFLVILIKTTAWIADVHNQGGNMPPPE